MQNTSAVTGNGKKEKKANAFNWTSEKLLSFDMYTEAIGLNHSEEKGDFKSCAGACTSVLILLFTLWFTYQNAISLHERGGTLFTSTLLKNYNYNTRYFKQDDGFQMAFAIIDYAGENGEDEANRDLSEYLEIEIWQTYFSETGDSKEDKQLSFHKCSDEELGFA